MNSSSACIPGWKMFSLHNRKGIVPIPQWEPRAVPANLSPDSCHPPSTPSTEHFLISPVEGSIRGINVGPDTAKKTLQTLRTQMKTGVRTSADALFSPSGVLSK